MVPSTTEAMLWVAKTTSAETRPVPTTPATIQRKATVKEQRPALMARTHALRCVNRRGTGTTVTSGIELEMASWKASTWLAIAPVGSTTRGASVQNCDASQPRTTGGNASRSKAWASDKKSHCAPRPLSVAMLSTRPITSEMPEPGVVRGTESIGKRVRYHPNMSVNMMIQHLGLPRKHLHQPGGDAGKSRPFAATASRESRPQRFERTGAEEHLTRAHKAAAKRQHVDKRPYQHGKSRGLVGATRRAESGMRTTSRNGDCAREVAKPPRRAVRVCGYADNRTRSAVRRAVGAMLQLHDV